MAANVCLICLRSDRKLKVIDSKLSEFHDELCDFSINAIDLQYCTVCEYLLRKMYNFRAKCLKAVSVLKKYWKKTKAIDRPPIDTLSAALPGPDLGVWTPNSSGVFTFEHREGSGTVSPRPKVEPLSENNSLGALGSQAQIIIVPIEDIIESGLDGNQEMNNPLSNKDIKQETDKGQSISNLNALDLQEYITLKAENPSFHHLLDDADIAINDTEKLKLNSSDHELEEILDTYSSDEDYATLKLIKNKIKCQLTPAKLETEKDKPKRKRQRVRKKEIREEDSNKKRRFHTKKDIIAELMSNDNSDTADVNGAKVKSRKVKPPFCKESLKQNLIKKFESHQELKMDDGTVIDKEFILNSLDDKVTEFVMRQLWNTVVGKTTFKPQALKLLKSIQNKYKNEYASVFDVEYFNTKEKMVEEFENRRTYESYVKAEFKCEICFQGFKHQKKLEYHSKCHEVSAGEFVCTICSVRQKTRKSLISHVNSHEAVYKCKLCPLVTYYKWSMKNHFNWHKGVKFKCEPCDTVFGSWSSYRTHVSYRHVRGHVCTACGRAFRTRAGLKCHATRHHQNASPPPTGGAGARCEACALTFPSLEVYERHVRVTHETPKRGRRPGFTYNSQKIFRKKPVFKCRACDAVGSSVGWLNLHFVLEHPTLNMDTVYADKKTNLCHVCGKGFSSIYSLRGHLASHSAVLAYSCVACGARFARAVSLRLHKLLHAPPSLTCSYCGKKFRSKSNLSNHVRFHVGDRRYKCKICGKGFLHRGTLNEHVRGVHHNVRRVRKRGVANVNGARGVPLNTEERDE